MRDQIIHKARSLLGQNQIRSVVDESYNPDSVYEYLENAESSFAQLKVLRIKDFIHKMEPNNADNKGMFPPI